MHSAMNNTWLWCVVGFACFVVGGILRMFMVVRVNGWAGYLKNQSGVPEAYRRLANERNAPLWPLPASYALIVIGIATVFGSILRSK